jgi:hypothetical protein
MPKKTCPENVRHRSSPHGHPRMAAVGLLDGVDRQEADGVDAELIQAWLRRRGQKGLLHGDNSKWLNIKTFIEIIPFKDLSTIDDGFEEY